MTNGATDQALGPLKSRRKPLPNELADTAPEDQPGGGKDKEEKGSLRINIALDLDVEVHLTARIKGKSHRPLSSLLNAEQHPQVTLQLACYKPFIGMRRDQKK